MEECNRGVQQNSTWQPCADHIDWRNYKSSWQDRYWDLLYKRGTYVDNLRNLNLRQAARIMDLELKLRISNRLVEEFRPREGLEASKYWDVK